MIIFLVYLYLPCRETYSDFSFTPIENIKFSKTKSRKIFNPEQSLPPGFEEIDYLRSKRNTKSNSISLHNQEEYCKKTNNLCFPCSGWKLIGPPACLS